MKKYAVVLAVVVLFIFASVVSVFANDIIWQDISRGNSDIKTILIHPDNSRIIYIGSKRGIFKSQDGAETWRNILLVKGQNRIVNLLCFDPKDKNSLYAATGGGLFYSANQGKDWKRIFKGKNALENECTALAVSPFGIYLGTKAGLFVSKDKGRLWYKETAKLASSRILTIAYNLKELDYLYIACVDGVFKSRDKGQSWEKIFTALPTENGNSDTEEETEDRDEEERNSCIRYISIDPNNANYLYLATSRGVYKSKDGGQSWELLPDYGLLNRDVKFLLVSDKSRIYAATKSGVFEYREGRWQELSFALTVEEINSLSLDNQDNLYAACDKGLFKAKLTYFGDDNQNNIMALYYKDEPKINEVQQVAIKYAEVEPEKIARWRKQAAKRAILPKITISADRDRNRTVSNSIWGTYSSYNTNGNVVTAPGRYYVGPDDETNYNNKNWGVSLTWELGDLIWSDDQTSIDVRSRLMVQLRDDILDEVTKLYFERLRVKMEIDNLSIEDRKKRFEKELKLQELTASLDALTGGYFSQQLKSKTES